MRFLASTPTWMASCVASQWPGIDKYVLIEEGTLRVVVGEEHHVLQDGAFYFRASLPHRFENAGPNHCIYLAILDYAPLG